MNNSDIIYSLNYPNFLDDFKSQDEDFSFNLPMSEDRRPIIVLFGWAGAKDEYLRIYSRIYEAKGFITLRCIIPLKTMFLRRRRMPTINEYLVKFLFNHHFGDRLFIIHCFSTGGAFAYQHFVEAVNLYPRALQIKGVIFDSAPSKRRIQTTFTAALSIFRGNIIFSYFISILILLAIIASWTLEFILIRVIRRDDIIEFKPYANLLNHETNWPQHFIYSKTDRVTLYQDVESFAQHRKSLGVEISMKMFENTPHVKHYAQNKRSYTESIFTFMNECLEPSMV